MFGYGYNHFYRYTASWIPDCQMKYGQSINTFSANCSQGMISNFRKCRSLATVNVRANIYNTGNNGGQGGHTDIQCLRYQYVSTRHAVFWITGSPDYVELWHSEGIAWRTLSAFRLRIPLDLLFVLEQPCASLAEKSARGFPMT